jgi:hypothetical protein
MSTDSVTIEVPAGRFTARPYVPSDEARVLELWRLAFGKPLDPEIWRWKYAENPFGSRVLLCFDEHDEGAIVMYSGVPFRANWRGREVEIVQLMDIMSHPDYRKTGLFVKTAEAYFDRFAGGRSVLYYGIPGQYHFEIGAKYLAYSRLESGVEFLVADVARLAGRSAARGAVREEHAPGAEFDRLWSSLRAHYPLAVKRDLAFWQWRFRDHPIRNYRVYGCRSGLLRRLRAAAVVAVDGAVVKIVDLLLPPDGEVGSAFMTGLAEIVGDQGAESIEVWLPGGHFAAEVLRESGFEPAPEPLGIVPTARSFDERLSIDWVARSLYYTMADADLL